MKILFSQDLKVETKNPRHDFVDFALFFNIAVDIFGKKIFWSSWSPRKRFF